jgi:hypothetical protein
MYYMYDLFSTTVSGMGCVASNDMVINERWIEMDVDGSSYDLF